MPSFADIAIAATAEAHALTALTSNVRHFAPLRAAALNPIETSPPLPSAEIRK
jgi:predicted nucleic acid-binding protein